MISKLNCLFLCGAIILISGKVANAQSIASPYEVGIWNGFRSAAICYTFDDNYPYQLSVAVPEFNKYGFKMTMFAITGNWSPMVNWTGLQAAALQGHEVGSHTITHPSLDTLNYTRQTTELRDSKNTIESYVKGQKCITTAYPYCVKGADSITKKYYIAARVCSGAIEPRTPASYMSVSSMVCGSLGINTIAAFKSKFASAAAMKGWCVFLIHGMDDENSWSPLQSSILKQSLLFLSYRKSKFWVTTFRNAALYSKERNAANVVETTNLDTIKIIQVSHTLNDSIFNLPLTIRRPLPAGWPSAIVKQGDTAVYSRIVQIDTTVYLAFDVVPDGSDVKICKSNETIIPVIDTIPPDSIPSFTSIKNIDEKNSSNHDLKVWVTNDLLNFSVPSSSGMDLTITLYDMMGRNLVLFKVKRAIDGSGNVQLPNNILKSNGYIISITDGKNLWSKQIMLL